MIGSTYQSAAIQAVLGPAHSDAIPAVLHGAWLDGSLAVLSMTGVQVPHDAFGPTATGVANTTEIDGGLCPATVPAFFALMDAASSGNVIAASPVTFNTAPAEDAPLTLAPGVLAFNYAGGGS